MNDVIQQVRMAFDQHPRLQRSRDRIGLTLERGDLVLDGEVQDIATKKTALEVAAAIPGVDRIIDRLHVEPSQRLPDDVLLNRVCETLASDSSLQYVMVLPHDQEVRGTPLPAGEPRVIAVSVSEGVVTLDGRVDSLAHKRLAGVLAWWVPGVRDVVDGIGVEPDEEDSDFELTDSVRLAIEKDPTVHRAEVHVRAHDGVVVLTGTVATEAERRRIEGTAWSVFRVDRVENEMVVAGSLLGAHEQPPSPG